MTPGSRFRSWLLAVLRRTRMESEMDAELRFHIEAFAEDLVRSGVPRAEALRLARIEFGGIERAKEECREARGVNFLETLFQDLRFGQRLLRKAPGFTTVAVLTLALGIGANAAIFSYIDAWFIKPLPYPQPDRLVSFETQDKKHGWTSGGVTSAADFFDFQKQNTSFEQTAAWGGASLNLTGDGPPELIDGGRVSWNFFDMLGAKPILGRTFTAEDDRSGAPHVAILSQGLWQGRYAGDPKIIGRNIAVGGEAYTVVGVMPGTFQFPLMGIANLWTPLALTEMQRADRGNVWLPAFGRLKPGVTLEQARAETATFFAHLEKEFPKTNTNLTWLVSSVTHKIRKEEGGPEVMICFVVVGLVLLIACANVANLMLARATSRTREFAVRGALGATRKRLAGQLLTESLLLFLVGGAASLLFASWGMHWIESQTPGHIRGYIVNYGHVELDFSMLMFTLGITLLCGLVFGFAPAFENSQLDVNHTLKETSGQTSGSKRGARLRRIFVAAEIALAVVVLISATLLVKSFIISVRSSPGYNPANVLVAQLALPKTKYTEDSQLRNFSDEVLSRIRALPGAASTGVASHVPFGGFGQGIEFQVVGKPLQPGERPGAPFTAVSADYFSTMQIGLVEGRFFDSSDAYGTSPSIIISQTMARQAFSGEDPIGKTLSLGEQHSVGTIVGIVNDIKMNYLRERPGWHIYVPLAQFPSRTFGFVVRSSGDPTIMAAAVRDAIWAVDRDQPISSVEPLENLIAVVNTGDRLVADLMVFFSFLAMFLGAIGIYGVMAHLVSQRIHEIGIRMALGASPVHVMSMVLGQGLKLALGGVAAGVLAALGATRLLATQLYQVTPTDPLTFIGVPLLFAIVALAACYLPAWRGMRVDPLVALRYE
ncbi:MAG TPA: ABC transporter permease [Verrucomicrobiae bacterium]|nr:ABC transporter permease [Verrucomicrobiae bacterium]